MPQPVGDGDANEVHSKKASYEAKREEDRSYDRQVVHGLVYFLG